MSKLVSINPANEKENGAINVSTEDEIKKKVAQANVAKETWRRTNIKERKEHTERVMR